MKISEDDLERLCSLSKRQKAVVKALCSGLTTKEAADKLDLSVKTVEYHRSSIYMKTKMNNPVLLVKFAIRVGLASLCLLGIAMAQSAPLAVPNSTTILAFDYPTNQVPNSITNPVAMPATTNVVYRYFAATNLQGSSTAWVLVATQTNPPAATNNGKVYVYSPPLPIYGSQTFYTATTSNSWGTSFFSGLAATAPPPAFPQNLFLNSVNP